MKIRYILLSALLAGVVGVQGATRLEQLFAAPPEQARPWTFWYWMYGNVTDEAIKADLTAMKQIGLGGAYLMPIKSVESGKELGGLAPQLSPEWWRLVGRSLAVADSLGLKMGMHVCDGFALAGGPWIAPEESMQMVVSADTVVKGGKLKALRLPQPQVKENYYRDIALLALPVRGTKIATEPKISVSDIGTPSNPSKGVAMDESGVIRSSELCRIDYEYPSPVTVRNLELQLGGNNYQAHRLTVLASTDGVNYRIVKKLTPARHGWQNTDFHTSYSLPSTTARYFRFEWTPVGSEPGSEDLDAAKWKPNLKIKRIALSGEPRLDGWEGKAGLVWRVAPPTSASELPAELCVPKSEIIDLTSHIAPDGTLTATLPAGEWRLLRLGHTSTGHTNATGGAGRGLECDKFSEKAVAKQFDGWFGRVFSATDSLLARKVLKYTHIDSWECGSQNWSANFPAEFARRRGYDLRPYLPLFAGIPVDDAATSERVLRDVRTTIAELVPDVFYKVMGEKARQYGCETSAECVSPTMVSDGLLHYRAVDYPMGEFWLRSPTHDKPNDMLDAVHGAHIYGKNIVQAEAFTEVRGTWDETPGMLKTLLDRNYALGINRIFYHVNTHNPFLDRKPGMTLDGIGLFFQRDNTWWSDGGRALTDYMRRCQALLQYGKPVTDIAVFTGEEIPRRAILPDRLVSSLPGIFGAERVASERVRLANEGQPLRTIPVGVSHSANMADPEKWVNPLRGYAYDSMNCDALLRLASVRDGKLTLPGGAAYSILVIPGAHPMMPDTKLTPEVRAKVAELVKAGVVVPEIPCVSDDFSALGVTRDAELPADIAWCHRREQTDDTDLYFISNQLDEVRRFTASFRVAGRRPEVWNPLTGEIDRSPEWRTVNGRTEVDLSMDPAQSLFIVFAEPTSATSGHAPELSLKAVDIAPKTWRVTFNTTGHTEQWSALSDWTASANDSVKYYSGTATYTASFKAPKLSCGERAVIWLGRVADVASVRVNGIDCGTAWTAPYEVDVTAALRKGRNEIEISVTNTWANALLGADQGKAPFAGIWTNGKYRRAEKTLIPAGLFGPVGLIITSEK